MWSVDDYIEVCSAAAHNKSTIEDSKYVGCFHCLHRYPSSFVTKYGVDKGDDTAICAVCGEESVLGDKTGWPIQDDSFLQHMNWYGFCNVILKNGSVTTCKSTRPCAKVTLE